MFKHHSICEKFSETETQHPTGANWKPHLSLKHLADRFKARDT